MTTKTTRARPAPGSGRVPRAAGAARSAAAPRPEATASVKFYKPDNYQPQESVGYMMRRILNMVTQEVDRQLEPNGLTSAQWVPLLKLYMGHSGTVAELARDCNLDAGGMTRLLDRLEAKGLVRRVRSNEDRRVVNIELTDEGRSAAKGIPTILCGVQNAHMRGFTVEEWQLLKGMLRRILDNATAIQAEGQQT